MTVVLDASVLVKWLLADPEREPDTLRAAALMNAVGNGAIDVLQPAHWLIEVGAVLARLSPETAGDDLVMLRALEIPTSDELDVLRRGCDLAIAIRHHLFDTLYHAVALEHDDAFLVTADEQYYRKARDLGRMQLLSAWNGP